MVEESSSSERGVKYWCKLVHVTAAGENQDLCLVR
jgi:hypothetical protein